MHHSNSKPAPLKNKRSRPHTKQQEDSSQRNPNGKQRRQLQEAHQLTGNIAN